MAGAHHNQESIDRALAALMASAVEDSDGSWSPQFSKVSRDMKRPQTTLRRWWRARDRRHDGELRRGCTRARTEVRQEGAEDWLRVQVGRVKDVVVYITNPLHYSTELVEVPFSEGKKFTVEGTRPDHAARAMKLTVEVLKDLDGLLESEGGAGSPEKRMASLRKAAAQVGLTGRKK